ncbi:MAG: type II toxin-antitoxin system VapC family toxin [Lachnospiraceae bacterium]
MRYMLDTNICIYSIKHKPEQVFQRLQEHEPADICISSVTYAELVHGVEKSQAIEKNRLALALLLANIEILNFDANAAESYGKIRADLEKQGTPIGPLNMMIAGHAKSLNYTVVTNNTKEFNRVAGLKLENWAVALTNGIS